MQQNFLKEPKLENLKFHRGRRMRLKENTRSLIRETTLHLKDFIYPLFVIEGENIKNHTALPDIYQMSIDYILRECEDLLKLNIHHVMLFGIPKHKDPKGSSALSENSIVAQTLRAIKSRFNEINISVDLCLCEYTDHGHCGILDPKLKTVDNDATLKALGQQAVILAQNGADIIAPSAMMDGMVATIRAYLDLNHLKYVPIMSYSTKFASSYYGPFRDIANSTPTFGNRKSYQQDYSNQREAILESLKDEEEGADILMVKPALAYLDIIRDIKNQTLLPLAAYNVSGEYVMLKKAGESGLIDYKSALIETLTAFKRSGADIIISYHTKEFAKLIQHNEA